MEELMTDRLTKNMELEDLARDFPVAIKLLSRRDIVCLRCGTPLWKTVEQAIQDAGYEDVDTVLAEVNAELAAEMKR